LLTAGSQPWAPQGSLARAPKGLYLEQRVRQLATSFMPLVVDAGAIVTKKCDVAGVMQVLRARPVYVKTRTVDRGQGNGLSQSLF